MAILFIPFCASMGKELVIIMTQDERWTIRYKEVVEFIKTNHRNPSKYDMEERNMYNYIKHTRKQMNARTAESRENRSVQEAVGVNGRE